MFPDVICISKLERVVSVLRVYFTFVFHRGFMQTNFVLKLRTNCHQIRICYPQMYPIGNSVGTFF